MGTRHVGAAAADTPEVRRDWLPWALGATVVVLAASALALGVWL